MFRMMPGRSIGCYVEAVVQEGGGQTVILLTETEYFIRI